jgi:diguanylate cyclase (GGDEF)-like protein
MITQIQSLLLRVIDPWTPPGVSQGSPEKASYRFFISILLGSFAYLIVLMAATETLLPLKEDGKRLINQFSLSLSIGITTALLTLRIAAKRHLAMHIFIATLSGGLIYVVIITGGLSSPAVVCSVVIPALATMSLGAGAGILWSLFSLVIGSAMFIAGELGFEYRNIIVGSNQSLAEFFCILTTHAFIIFIAVYYELNSRSLGKRLRKEQNKYFHLAHHDSLTGIANRRHFIEVINREISNAERRGQGQFTLLYFDLNKFKEANDKFGHHFGDEVLIAFANRLRLEIREDDCVARLGGDEFALMLKSLGQLSVVQSRLQTLVSKLSDPLRIGGVEHQVSASVGYAIYPEHGDNYETLLKVADQSMYRVKRGEREVEAAPSPV